MWFIPEKKVAKKPPHRNNDLSRRFSEAGHGKRRGEEGQHCTEQDSTPHNRMRDIEGQPEAQVYLAGSKEGERNPDRGVEGRERNPDLGVKGRVLPRTAVVFRRVS